MRILLIAPQPFYEDRGSPIAVRETLGVLSELGFDVDVATYPLGSAVAIPGVRLLRTGNPLRFREVPVGFSSRKLVLDMCLFGTVLRLARRNHYDCAHGVEEGAAMALACKALFGIPVIYDMHSSLPEQLRKGRGLKTAAGHWLTSQVERWLVKRADCIIASRGLAPRVSSIVPGKAVWECSFNGSDPRPRNEELARHLGLIHRPTIVYAGTFAPYQGLELLIKAAALVRAEIPEVAFVLVGGTEFELSRLRRLVAKRKLSGTVQLHQRRPRSEVADYLALADVLVLPRTVGENAPLKIYDYMKSAKPIVATDIPAHRAVLSEETALLVPPETTTLAGGILLALRDTEHRRKLSRSAEIAARAEQSKPLQMTVEQAYHYVAAKRLRPPRGST